MAGNADSNVKLLTSTITHLRLPRESPLGSIQTEMENTTSERNKSSLVLALSSPLICLSIQPPSISVKVCGSSKSRCPTERLSSECQRRVSTQTPVSRSCLGRCWGGIQFAGEMKAVIEEGSKEKMMKGQEEERRSRVTAQGLMVRLRVTHSPKNHFIFIEPNPRCETGLADLAIVYEY
ncbi:unnamed protein product [Pleuronectes platessa]|uniref:Uncharacterized protein n=1 Tax=Pleuronectes platessa TaxID=8262 RepID=A0A9N7VRW5_PLEPL|nr:unnamed protein product [Pleuronectes platessa]